MAEGVGFEPTVGLHPRQFSRLEQSTTLPPFQTRATLSSILAAKAIPAMVRCDVSTGCLQGRTEVVGSCEASIIKEYLL